LYREQQSPDIVLGASTRATTHVLLAAKTFAALQGRSYVIPDDVKFVVPPVYRHRVLLKPEAEIEGLDADSVIQRVLGPLKFQDNNMSLRGSRHSGDEAILTNLQTSVGWCVEIARASPSQRHLK